MPSFPKMGNTLGLRQRHPQSLARLARRVGHVVASLTPPPDSRTLLNLRETASFWRRLQLREQELAGSRAELGGAGPHTPLRLRRWLWGLAKPLPWKLRERLAALWLRRSGAFDADWYLARHADIAEGATDPMWHYLRFGAKEGRDPASGFSASRYRHRHPECGPDENPLLHALLQGRLQDGGPLAAIPAGPPPCDPSSVSFRAAPQPRLSVLMDARNGWPRLGETLRLLAQAQQEVPLEIILLSRSEAGFAKGGLRHIRAMGDDPRAMALGLAECRAPHLLLMAPGCLPEPDAPAALLRAFSDHPDLSVACGMILGADGRVVQAGGGFGANGTPFPRGAGLAEEHFDLASPALVDIAPPGLACFSRAALEALGDVPAQAGTSWEAATGLALRLRQAGQRILYEPRARGRLPAPLPDRSAPLPRTLRRAVMAMRSPAPRALFVDHVTPMPDRDSGSGDIVGIMRIMRRSGYEVTFIAAQDLSPPARYVEELRRLGITCVAGPQAPSLEAYLEASGSGFDVALLYRFAVAERCLDLLRREAPWMPIILNTVDLHHIRERREAEISGSAEAMATALRSRRHELAAISAADVTMLISPAEQALIAAELPGAVTRVIPIVRDIPADLPGIQGRRDIAFVGGFGHPPNVDAITWFLVEAWPLVQARLPALRLLVVGSDPPASILAMARDAPGIEVLGHVPDLAGLLSRCRLTVAPLRYGAGIKGKVVSSLIHGVPCIASSIAAEGMGLRDGEEVLLAESAEDFAAAITRGCTDDALWNHLSAQGLAFARANFSTEHVAGLMRRLLCELDLPAGG